MSDKALPRLTDINLSTNPITDWSYVLVLSSLLPNLKILALNECLLSSIEFPEEDTLSKNRSFESSTRWFPSLTSLQISSCKIDNWTSVEALNTLSNLSHLKFKLNPILYNESQETCRQLIIASINSLKFLNGSFIEKQERRGAEIDFLKKYGKQYLTVQASNDSIEMEKFSKEHPR